jgi:Na+/proline symporter
LEQVRFARVVTLAAGGAITAAAYGIDLLVADRNILEMMPRSFNCFLVPLGVLFLLGMFAPFVGMRAAVCGSLVSFVTAVSIAYAKELYGLQHELSFTWILPGAVGLGLLVGLAGSLFDRSHEAQTAGLTWFTRHQLPLVDHRLFADWVIDEVKKRKAT